MMAPHARRIAMELKASNPKRKALGDEEVLIGRFLNSLFFSPAVVRKITSASGTVEWNDWDFVHHARRDRRNLAAIKRAIAKGKTHLGGFKIGGVKSEPYLMRWTRKEAWDLMREIEGLAYNLYEIGELAGIKPNPYPDTEDSIAPWR